MPCRIIRKVLSPHTNQRTHNFTKNVFAAFIGLDFGKYLVFPFWQKSAIFALGHNPDWYRILEIGWPLIGFPAIYAVYRGKKWGAYVLLTLLPLSLFVYHIYFKLPLYSRIIYYIGSIIFLYLIYRQWKRLK